MESLNDELLSFYIKYIFIFFLTNEHIKGTYEIAKKYKKLISNFEKNFDFLNNN